jgi:hypothetical protein
LLRAFMRCIGGACKSDPIERIGENSHHLFLFGVP